MNRIVIINGKLIFPDRIENGTIITENRLISYIGNGDITVSDNDTLINATGNYVSPGFMDIHVHGGGGHDFMDATVEAYIKIAELHAKHGTTGLLPTTLTSTEEELFHSFAIYREAKKLNKKGSKYFGIHLEGPYFSYNQRGAQDPKYLQKPNPDSYLTILESCEDIKRWSIAPELEGAIELGKELKSRNILASVAHTDAICEEVMEAFENGYTLMTHLYSAMSTVTRKNAYRYAGALEAAYLIDDMDVEIIADGIHLPKSLLQFVYKFKGPDRTALVTDAMRAAGMPDGLYKLGSLNKGQDVLVEDGVAKLPDKSAFAGSVATADRLVRTMTQVAGIPLTDVIKMISITPARILKMDNIKGSLTMGKDADIVIFDDNINIQTTIVEGNIIYTKEE